MEWIYDGIRMEKFLNVSLVVPYDSEKRMLLQHRTSDAKVLPDFWAFFGGGIKDGESPRDAVRREALEELDLELEAPMLFLDQDFEINGLLGGHMYLFVEAFYGDKSRLSLNEGQGWGWFRLFEADCLRMIAHDRKLLKDIDKYIRRVS